jgi:hypothetical protein
VKTYSIRYLVYSQQLLPVGSQAKFCLFSETPDFRVLRPSPPARPILRGAQRNFPNRRSGADWDIHVRPAPRRTDRQFREGRAAPPVKADRSIQLPVEAPTKDLVIPTSKRG